MEMIGTNGLMVGAIVLAGISLGFGLGLRFSTARARARQLEGQLEDLRKEHERYRGKVADHFAGTSERLRELTLQYREIYNHLSEGAGELCPEGFEKLEGGLGLDALPEESDAPEPEPH